MAVKRGESAASKREQPRLLLAGRHYPTRRRGKKKTWRLLPGTCQWHNPHLTALYWSQALPRAGIICISLL